MKVVVLYTQSGCRDSEKLKKLLDTNNVDYDLIDISFDVGSKRAMFERSGGKKGYSTPQIFIHGQHIDNNEVIEHIKTLKPSPIQKHITQTGSTAVERLAASKRSSSGRASVAA